MSELRVLVTAHWLTSGPAARVLALLNGDAAVHTMPAPMMAAEDWSYVLQRIPGVMVNLGARPHDRELAGFPQNHSSLVVFDEDAMAAGVALNVAVARDLDRDA